MASYLLFLFLLYLIYSICYLLYMFKQASSKLHLAHYRLAPRRSVKRDAMGSDCGEKPQ